MSVARFDFYSDFAKNFFEDIAYQRSSYYYFLGKLDSWNDGSSPEVTDEFERTSANDRIIRDNIVYLRKILPTEVSVVSRLIFWESNKIFAKWDHTKDMELEDFYCVTPDTYRVYKCLDNNNGSASTEKPTGAYLYPVKTSDGYLWKYMYTISPVRRKKFLSENYIPVQNAVSESFYNRGAIEEVSVIDGGSGYTNIQESSITISTDTTSGEGAEAEIESVDSEGAITSIILKTLEIDDSSSPIIDGSSSPIIDGSSSPLDDSSSPLDDSSSPTIDDSSSPIIDDSSSPTIDGSDRGSPYLATGSGYNYGARVIVNSSTGTGAQINPVIVNGEIVDFEIEDGGINYTTDDTIEIVVGQAVITPTISQQTGGIIDITINDPGIGYETAPTLTLEPTAGSGAYGNAQAVIKAVVYEGKIVNVTVEDPGQNYLVDTTTTLVVSGDGEDAAFTPQINNETGEIVGVFVDNPGQNYTYASIAVDGPGSDARLIPVITQSDFQSNQSIVEQTTVKGAIYSVEVTNGGNNYSSQTTISIEGDGVGAEATVVLDQDSISQVIMTSYGSGYTYANVVFNDPNRIDNPLFEDASAYAILPPINGHGYDAVNELYGKTVAIYTNIRNEQGIFITDQDYHQFGVLENPTDLITNLKSRRIEHLVVFDIELDSVSDIEQDDLMINNNTYYRVASVDQSTNRVKLKQKSAIYRTPSTVFYKVDDPFNIPYSVLNIFSVPLMNKYSGNLLYTANRESFTVTEEQSITIRTYLSVNYESI